MRKAVLGLSGLFLAAAGGCATVSVYETVSVADVQLTEPQSDLHKAAADYCDMSSDAGWAEGESNWARLTRMFGGEVDDEGAYWRRIGADELAPASVMARVAADAEQAAEGLDRINGYAEVLIASTEAAPEKADIVQFERALIHAKQARESFSIALGKAKNRAADNVPIDAVLADFDAALASAKTLADELAAARMSKAVASVETAVS